MSCLKITEENVKDYIQLLATIDNCKLSFYNPNKKSYAFTVQDLKLMVKMDLKIVFIETESLKTEGEDSKLLEFVEVFRKMKHLEEFYFSVEDFETKFNGAPSVHLMTDLPIKMLFCRNFEFQKENINDIVTTLSKIKSLVWFCIDQEEEGGYRLTPGELASFKNIPHWHSSFTKIGHD